MSHRIASYLRDHARGHAATIDQAADIIDAAAKVAAESRGRHNTGAWCHAIRELTRLVEDTQPPADELANRMEAT